MEKENKRSINKAFYKAVFVFWKSSPVLLGVILLLGLFHSFIPKEVIYSFFTGDIISDTIIGAAAGSLLAGNAITSYIIGGELLKEGVSLFAVTAFVVAWVTVGVFQFPAEAEILGRRFALARNMLSFALAIIISAATVSTVFLIT